MSSRPPFSVEVSDHIIYNFLVTTTSVWDVFREGSKFFMKEGDVYETLKNLAKRLREEDLDYAVIGAMALAAHGYRRFTEDVHILPSPETLEYFRDNLVGLGYLPAFRDAKKSFRDTRTGVKIEVMTTGEYPGDGKPQTCLFSRPGGRSGRQGRALGGCARDPRGAQARVRTVSAPHRLKDLADVQELILHLRLPLELAGELDESVRAEYERLWNTAQQATD